MDSTQGDASKEHKEKHGEDEHLVHGNTHEHEKETSSSSSTSSDDSSEEDFFQLDPIELNRALAEGSGFQNGETNGIIQSSNHGATNLSENGYMFSGSQMGTGMGMGRPFSPDKSCVNPEISVFATRQYPPRNDVPDPNRIPSSIFERSKSSTPMEWSVASNESLFSIHVGNSSFSRDHIILMGRSGELGMPPISPVGRASELTNTPPISPLSSPANIDMGHIDMGHTQVFHNQIDMGNMNVEDGLAQPGAAAAANAEAMKDVLRAAADVHADKNEPPDETAFLSSSVSHRSDGSTTSFRSFAFPILLGYFRLTGEGRSGSVKVEPEPQKMKSEPLQQNSSETPKPVPPAGGSKWFPCFSCCSLCC